MQPNGQGRSASDQSPDFYGAPLGSGGCSLAKKFRMRPTAVVQSRLQVRSTAFPPASECTSAQVRALVYRNGALQRDLKTIGVLTGSNCNRPSVGDVFPFGDGADWRVIVQVVRGGAVKATRSVTTTLTNQQQ